MGDPEALRAAEPSRYAELSELHLATGRTDVLGEVIEPHLAMAVFGAEHDAIPLVRMAKELGWHVTIVDH